MSMLGVVLSCGVNQKLQDDTIPRKIMEQPHLENIHAPFYNFIANDQISHDTEQLDILALLNISVTSVN